jgi:molecular chaperone HtpG
MAKQEFKTEIKQLLHLMIHSLYSNKEIFLRELISNSSDAIDKLKYLTLTEDNLKSLKFDPRIDVKIDNENKTIKISDTGIGMNEIDLVENLGTIAKSGTKAFLEQMKKDEKVDNNLIGQFGVGFYSAFIVAKKVEVLTKKAGEEKAYKWSSEANGEFEIVEAEKENYGTEITLFIREDSEEFLDEYKIENTIKKYSNHIPYPIYMEKTKYLEDGKTEKEIVQVNSAKALWTKNKKELSDEDYIAFYETIAHSNEKPLKWIHTKAEGAIEYTTLFYLPSKAPLDLYRVDYQSGVKLYIKRVFITDDDKELLPTYLRFVRGIIDSEDLPLNVSREILQSNAILAKIKNASVKNIFKMISKLDDEKYKTFWNEFGKVLKEGLGDYTHQEKILELSKFDTNKRDFVSLDEYIEANKDEKVIYYLIGKDKELLKNSPLLENEDKEVLLLSDEIDELVFPMVTKYKEYEFKPLNKEEVKDLSDEYKDLVAKVKVSLGDEVKEVKVTNRLKETPAVLVFDEDFNPQMEMMMRQMGMEAPKPKAILELNPNSEIIKKLNENYNEEILKVLFDEAKLALGLELSNPKEFIDRINSILKKSL